MKRDQSNRWDFIAQILFFNGLFGKYKKDKTVKNKSQNLENFSEFQTMY